MRWFGFLLWLWALATIAYGVSMRQGLVARDPGLLALLVALLFLGCCVAALAVLVRARHERRRRLRAGFALLALVGVLVSLGAGLHNWVTSVQGTALLHERETLRVGAREQFSEFEAGPLAGDVESGDTVALEKVVLAPGGPDGFVPQANVRLVRPGLTPVSATISLRSAAPLGELVVLQGAFGFAPRIVLLREGRTFFDEKVPFVTSVEGPGSLSYERSFTIERESLEVRGAVELASLDEKMKGHATLRLELSRRDQPLGRGTLQPGQVADLEGGYRIGFAGLTLWSELIVTTPSPRAAMLLGFGLAALGFLGWLGAVIRARVAR